MVLRIYELPSIQTASSHGRYDRFAFASEAFGHSCLVSSSVYRELDFLAESRRRRTLSVLQVGMLRSSEWRIVGFTGSRIHNSQLGPFGEIQKQISIMTSTLLAFSYLPNICPEVRFLHSDTRAQRQAFSIRVSS